MLHYLINCIIIIVVYTVPAAGILNIKIQAPAISNCEHPNSDPNYSPDPNPKLYSLLQSANYNEISEICPLIDSVATWHYKE